jgi:hypothetical protein
LIPTVTFQDIYLEIYSDILPRTFYLTFHLEETRSRPSARPEIAWRPSSKHHVQTWFVWHILLKPPDLLYNSCL